MPVADSKLDALNSDQAFDEILTQLPSSYVDSAPLSAVPNSRAICHM